MDRSVKLYVQNFNISISILFLICFLVRTSFLTFLENLSLVNVTDMTRRSVCELLS